MTITATSPPTRTDQSRRRPRHTRPRAPKPPRALARYYDPAVGRFTAVDPIVDTKQPGSLDRFGYALASPVTLKDPTGLWTPVGDTRHGGSYDGRRQLAISEPLGTPTKVRLPGKKYTPVFPRPDLVHLKIEPPTNNPFPPFYPPGYGPRPAPPSTTPAVEGKEDLGLRHVGSCVEFGAAFGIGGTFQGCSVTVGGEHGWTVSSGVGLATPGAGAAGSEVYSNAESLEDFAGGELCAGVRFSGGSIAGGATGCSSLGSSVYTVYANIAGPDAVPVGGGAYYSETEVISSRSVRDSARSGVGALESSWNWFEDLVSGGSLR